MATLSMLGPVLDHGIQALGVGLEIFGVIIIVTDIAGSTYLHLRWPMPEQDANAQ